MKITYILAGMILIMLCLGACSTSKLTDRQKSRLKVEEKSDIKSRVQNVNSYAHSATITDSSGQRYELTIFPADTFTFSLQDGFVGKASKVVVKGSKQQLIRKSDTSNYVGSLTTESEQTLTRDVTAKVIGRTSSVERRGVIWIGLGLGLIVGLVVLGICRKMFSR